MKEKLAAFSQKPEHKNVDSSIVAILTHGQEGAVCGTDSTGKGEVYQTDWIYVLSNAKLCGSQDNRDATVSWGTREDVRCIKYTSTSSTLLYCFACFPFDRNRKTGSGEGHRRSIQREELQPFDQQAEVVHHADVSRG